MTYNANFYMKHLIPWNNYKVPRSPLTISSSHSENKIQETGRLIENLRSDDQTYCCPRKIVPQTTLMRWNSITYLPMNIGKDGPEVSVSNVEKRDLPAIAHNTTKTATPTIINHNRGNISNEGRDIYLPSKLLPNTLKTKELISPSPEYKSWTHKSQKRPPHSRTTLLKRYWIFFTAEGKRTHSLGHKTTECT